MSKQFWSKGRYAFSSKSIQRPLDNELFDTQDPPTAKLYANTIDYRKPSDEWVLADPVGESGREQERLQPVELLPTPGTWGRAVSIEEEIQQAFVKHSGDGLMIFAGPYVPLIEALSQLSKHFNISYMPMNGMQVSFAAFAGDTPISEASDPHPNRLQTAFEMEILQAKEAATAARGETLARAPVEARRRAFNEAQTSYQKPSLTVLALPRLTSPHLAEHYATAQDTIFRTLAEILASIPEDHRPAFLSYMEEPLPIDPKSLQQRALTNGRDQLLQTAAEAGIPIELGAFGFPFPAADKSTIPATVPGELGEALDSYLNEHEATIPSPQNIPSPEAQMSDEEFEQLMELAGSETQRPHHDPNVHNKPNLI